MANLRQNNARETYKLLVEHFAAISAQPDLEDLITCLYVEMRLFVEYIRCVSKGVAFMAIFGYSYNYGIVAIGVWYVKLVPTFHDQPIVLPLRSDCLSQTRPL